MKTMKRIDPEDELSITYARVPGTREQILKSLVYQLDAAKAHLAAGREWVGGASQSYAVQSIERQIAGLR